MSDEADNAQADTGFFMRQAFEYSKKPELKKNGKCGYCGEQCEHRFCDKHCASDFETQQKMNRIKGLHAY